MAADLPEVKDSFDMKVAVTIAILAVVLSIINSKGDDSKTSALLEAISSTRKTTEAANNWTWYQAKSIKEHAFELQSQMLSAVSDQALEAGKRDELTAKYAAKLKEYREGPESKQAIMEKAKGLDTAASAEMKRAEFHVEVNERCDQGALLLEIAIVICSLAILAHTRAFWFIGMLLGFAGAVVGGTAWFM